MQARLRELLQRRDFSELQRRVVEITASVIENGIVSQLANVQRCQDTRMATHELGAHEARLAWQILGPHCAAGFVRLALPLDQVRPTVCAHACMIACVLRDVVLACQRLVRRYLHRNLTTSLLAWARRIKRIRSEFVLDTRCRQTKARRRCL